jgi:Bromodomain
MKFAISSHRILYDKKFQMFHYPVAEEEAPDYRSVIANPMDMATVLQRVDSGHYLTRTSFMKDIELIASNAKVSFLFSIPKLSMGALSWVHAGA